MNGMDSVSNNTQVTDVYTTGTPAKKTGVTGKTIGQPELSEKAAKYYEELKSRYSGMDFILVSSDMKETAQANAAAYANPNKMVVLIDEEKIERMAEDEQYRKKYEAVIASAGTKLPELKQALGNTTGVKGFGMQVNDNGASSFFAVMQKSFDEQAERIKEIREEKKAEKREAEKKAEKEAREERIYGSRDEEVVITADSIEELVRKIEEYNFSDRADNIKTESEKYLGTAIDFRG